MLNRRSLTMRITKTALPPEAAESAQKICFRRHATYHEPNPIPKRPTFSQSAIQRKSPNNDSEGILLLKRERSQRHSELKAQQVPVGLDCPSLASSNSLWNTQSNSARAPAIPQFNFPPDARDYCNVDVPEERKYLKFVTEFACMSTHCPEVTLT